MAIAQRRPTRRLHLPHVLQQLLQHAHEALRGAARRLHLRLRRLYALLGARMLRLQVLLKALRAELVAKGRPSSLFFWP